MPILEEEFLEPFARRFRFKQGLAHVPKNKPLVAVDLGCGPEIRFYYFAKKNNILIDKYIGVDPLIDKKQIKKHQKDKNVRFIRESLKNKIPLDSNSIDILTAFAFFEHINNPDKIIAEAYRILKPGGKIILTAPTPKAKDFLEFSSFKLKLISPREIDEHKQYFDQYSLLKLLPVRIKRSQTYHKYFEFKMNNLFVISKPKK